MKQHITAAEGRLGTVIPSLGAVATTFIAGVESDYYQAFVETL